MMEDCIYVHRKSSEGDPRNEISVFIFNNAHIDLQ
jgi:hypothetical protein